MKILLTGGTGFIGKPAAERLLARGHSLLWLSRHPSPGALPERCAWHHSDIVKSESYREAVAAFLPDAALHLAWQGIPDYSLATSLLNLEAAARLVETLLGVGCKHHVVSGSCWEYGKVSGCIREETEPVNAGIFGASKHALHHITAALCHSAAATLAWTRIFFAYGPHQKAASLAPTICRAVIEGKTPVLKTPAAVNDFIYIDDIAEAFVTLIENSANGVFNIGSGYGTAVGTFADEALSLAGHPPAFGGIVTADDHGFWADITKLRSFGWKPKTDLREGLRRTLDFYTSSC